MAQSHRSGTGRMLTHDGITDSIQGWARRLGMSDVTIRRRLAAGYSDEKALTEPVLPPRGGRPVLYELNGEKKMLSEWCEQYQISESCVRHRLRQGWALITALTTPPRDNKWGGGYTRPSERLQDVSADDIIDILNK